MKKFFMVCIVLLMSTICYADGVTEMMFDDASFPVEKTIVKRNKGESSYSTRTRELEAERAYSTELIERIDVLSEKVASYEIADRAKKTIVKEVKETDLGFVGIVGIVAFLVGTIF